MLDCLTISPSPTRTVRRAAGDVFGRLAAGPARLLLRTSRVQQKASVFAAAVVFSAGAWAVTPVNTPITNTATATYSVGTGTAQTNLSTISTSTVNTAACVTLGVKVDLMQYIPPGRAAQAPANASYEVVHASAYSPSGALTGPFTPLANPTLLGTAIPATLPSNLLLAPLKDAAGNTVATYSRNEPIFVRVVSYGANTNAAVADTIVVTLATNQSGDREVLQLTETGPSTGVFVGAISTVFSALESGAISNDGHITVTPDEETITGIYIHTDCNTGASIASSSSGLIDPYGVVFDSATGAPVNGAKITLIDTATGLPAIVYCDDQVTVLPQPLTSGAPTACDATMGAGSYRFPQVAAGSYRLVVVPPAGHVFPSAVASASLPAVVGLPADVPSVLGNPGLTPGASYGGVFTLWGPALKVDIPVDSGSNTLTIQKTADKAVVSTGEYVPYNLNISNNSAVALTGVQVADHVPVGFRYQKGSVKLDGVVTNEPLISADGSTLTFTLNMAAAGKATVRYVLEVTAGARTGTAENTATAVGGVTSNTGRASVLVREDLYRNKAILIGRVIDVSRPDNEEFANPNDTKSVCDDKVDNDFRGLAKARVVMQDGTYVLTDREGRWHIDNLRAGTHVVQLDLDSLPKDYEVVDCEQNDRFAGRLYSQFVNLQGGSLWRADFHVRKKPSLARRLTQTLSAQAEVGQHRGGLACGRQHRSDRLQRHRDAAGIRAVREWQRKAERRAGGRSRRGRQCADLPQPGQASQVAGPVPVRVGEHRAQGHHSILGALHPARTCRTDRPLGADRHAQPCCDQRSTARPMCWSKPPTAAPRKRRWMTIRPACWKNCPTPKRGWLQRSRATNGCIRSPASTPICR